MLKNLTIENYALIDHLEITFPDGLIIITGETGAGKSILLGALSLLLGGKADASLLVDPDKNCVIEGEFDLNGCDVPDIPEQIILRRILTPAGRSRAFVNDEPVSVAALNTLSSHLVDIHAQHNHLLLNDEKYQLSVLDYFAGNRELLDDYRGFHREYVEMERQLKEMDARIAKNREELEYKKFQLDKLIAANLAEGEMEELESEHVRLANAEEIREGIYSAASLLHSDSFSVIQNLKEVTQILRKYYNFVPEFGELANRIDSCRIECKDIEEELQEKGNEIVSSADRLQAVEERMNLLEGLMHRYGAGSVTELIDYRENLKTDVGSVETDEERRETLSGQLQELYVKRLSAGELLSESRKKAAVALEGVLKGKLRKLEMPYAEFKIEVTPLSIYGENGIDSVKFYFSANEGIGLQEISKVASGGELSRIMLCIKDVMAKYTGMPTMIFDEIDTGVSGSIADKMGELIGEMGENMQVIAITHLPQIAVKGTTHFLVYKDSAEGKAVSRVKLLSGSERVMEIARMLSGSELSDAAVENAKFLLLGNSGKAGEA